MKNMGLCLYILLHLFQDNEVLNNPDVASIEFALMVQREAIRQIQRWFFEDTAHYFHSHITKEIIVSLLLIIGIGCHG